MRICKRRAETLEKSIFMIMIMMMLMLMLMLMSNVMVMEIISIINCKAMRYEIRYDTYDTYEVMTRKARGCFGNYTRYTTIALWCIYQQSYHSQYHIPTLIQDYEL